MHQKGWHQTGTMTTLFLFHINYLVSAQTAQKFAHRQVRIISHQEANESSRTAAVLVTAGVRPNVNCFVEKDCRLTGNGMFGMTVQTSIQIQKCLTRFCELS